jgi:hypothetical protein
VSSNGSGSFSNPIATQLTVHPRLNWLLIDIEVDGDIGLRLAVDTLLPFSALNEAVWNKLANLGLLHEAADHRLHIIEPISIEGTQTMPIEARLSRRPAVRRVDGYLGLAFFNKFAEVRIDVPNRRLTLFPR